MSALNSCESLVIFAACMAHQGICSSVASWKFSCAVKRTCSCLQPCLCQFYQIFLQDVDVYPPRNMPRIYTLWQSDVAMDQWKNPPFVDNFPTTEKDKFHCHDFFLQDTVHVFQCGLKILHLLKVSRGGLVPKKVWTTIDMLSIKMSIKYICFPKHDGQRLKLIKSCNSMALLKR